MIRLPGPPHLRMREPPALFAPASQALNNAHCPAQEGHAELMVLMRLDDAANRMQEEVRHPARQLLAPAAWMLAPHQ